MTAFILKRSLIEKKSVIVWFAFCDSSLRHHIFIFSAAQPHGLQTKLIPVLDFRVDPVADHADLFIRIFAFEISQALFLFFIRMTYQDFIKKNGFPDDLFSYPEVPSSVSKVSSIFFAGKELRKSCTPEKGVMLFTSCHLVSYLICPPVWNKVSSRSKTINNFHQLLS